MSMFQGDDPFGYQGPAPAGGGMLGRVGRGAVAGAIGGVALGVGLDRLRQSLGMAAGRSMGSRVARGLGSLAGRMAGGGLGRYAGMAVGSTLGGMMGGPVGAFGGGYIGGMYGRQIVGGLGSTAGRGLMSLAGARGGVGGRMLGMAARGATMGVAGAGLGIAAGLLAEAPMEGPRGDVSDPRSIGMGMSDEGMAARRALRRHQQRGRGGGVVGTLARATTSAIEGTMDFGAALIPGVTGPGESRRGRVRQAELQGQANFMEARSVQAMQGGVARQAGGGVAVGIADAGTTDMHSMRMNQARQQAEEARWEQQRHNRRLEGGIL